MIYLTDKQWASINSLEDANKLYNEMLNDDVVEFASSLRYIIVDHLNLSKVRAQAVQRLNTTPEELYQEALIRKLAGVIDE